MLGCIPDMLQRYNYYFRRSLSAVSFISGDSVAIKIRMFSDYICPFCYLGKAIIDKLGKRFDIEIEHVGIEIHPETPVGGVDLRGRILGAEEMFEQIQIRGKEYGLVFCEVSILANSRKALIMGEYARTKGKNDEFTNEMFKAYFEDCLDIGKEEVIAQVSEKIGLTKQDATEALENSLFQEKFASNCLEARKHDISGVPTFIINERYTIVGAQPEQTFVELFEKIEKETAK